MRTYFALLRAINVGGHSILKMDPLRRAFEGMGFSNVATFIASGNVYFETRATGTRTLERRIDKGLEHALRRPLHTFVRTAAEMNRIAAYNAFGLRDTQRADINVIFLAAKPAAAALRRLKALKSRTDEFRAHGREVYWLRRKLPGRPDYASIPLDKTLQAPFTVRTQRTIMKMAAKHAAKRGKGGGRHG